MRKRKQTATKKSGLLHAVLGEDCVRGLSKLEPGSVQLAFADPPFNIGFEYDSYNDDRPAKEYLAWCTSWLVKLQQVLHKHGTLWLAIGPEFVSELDVAAKHLGFHKRGHIVWHYTFGVNSPRNFSRSNTHLLYFTRTKTQFTFNEDSVRLPSARQTTYADRRANPEGRLPDSTWILRPQEAPLAFAADSDTWHCPRICGTFKARNKLVKTQMPEQVLGRIIRLCSNPHELVLDPFVGSGTTLAVAKKLGRQGIGFELSPNYRDVAQARIDGVKDGDPLDTPDIQG